MSFGAGRTPLQQQDAAVAQLVEHVIRNDGVGGSSPFSGTTSQIFNGWDPQAAGRRGLRAVQRVPSTGSRCRIVTGF